MVTEAQTPWKDNIHFNIIENLPFGGWMPNASNLSLCVIGKTTASIS